MIVYTVMCVAVLQPLSYLPARFLWTRYNTSRVRWCSTLFVSTSTWLSSSIVTYVVSLLSSFRPFFVWFFFLYFCFV